MLNRIVNVEFLLNSGVPVAVIACLASLLKISFNSGVPLLFAAVFGVLHQLSTLMKPPFKLEKAALEQLSILGKLRYSLLNGLLTASIVSVYLIIKG